jgi:hypothetical protein
MADALVSGTSVRKDVGVQLPPRPPRGSGQGRCFLAGRGRLLPVFYRRLGVPPSVRRVRPMCATSERTSRSAYVASCQPCSALAVREIRVLRRQRGGHAMKQMSGDHRWTVRQLVAEVSIGRVRLPVALSVAPVHRVRRGPASAFASEQARRAMGQGQALVPKTDERPARHS